VIAWELPRGVRLAGLGMGKPNTIVTLHLLKAAAKQSRLDEAPLRKRAAVRGETVVEVKAGDAVLSLTEAWAVERFVAELKKQDGSKKAPVKKPAASGKSTEKKAS
jgi:hypothetical protein